MYPYLKAGYYAVSVRRTMAECLIPVDHGTSGRESPTCILHEGCCPHINSHNQVRGRGTEVPVTLLVGLCHCAQIVFAMWYLGAASIFGDAGEPMVSRMDIII